MKSDIILKLNDAITLGTTANKLQGFERAFTLATATQQLKDLLTVEYMKPILELQGNKLGFRTDKDNEGGYKLEVVKNCLIEAVLTGVQMVGNQFNIIASNCYITKEGFGYLLNNYQGLTFEIIPKLPRVSSDNKSAAIAMQINWQLNSNAKQTREIEFPIRINERMGLDAITGKATRKARAWLYNSISGLEISDGDIQDIKAEIIDMKTPLLEPKAKDGYKTIQEVQEDLLRGALTKEQADEIILKLK